MSGTSVETAGPEGESQGRIALLDERLLQTHKLAAIGQLSAAIAHEINNPLAIIQQEAELMNRVLQETPWRDLAEVDSLRESLREISRQVFRCRDIIQNLLNFARQRQPVVQLVDLNRLIEDMARLVEKEAKNRRITIRRQYQELPPVFTDAPQLRQVVLNLLSNAYQAIEQDGEITIATGCPDAATVEISISDTGCGIAPENLSKIFDPFFTTKPEGRGTGLGLSICHGLIQKLGGDIRVRSELHKGSTFTVRLPVTPPADTAKSAV